ncbi:protein kinase domain-containing protein [Streptomyces sp. SBT349]|uniref:protein kinase domain-containing protein n=1 Tax=Streptomyces sp. SBT349 TaxID=1580539 RepID=UPI00066B5818|nr:protein kinase [Streptomyces sp. SBT349]
MPPTAAPTSLRAVIRLVSTAGAGPARSGERATREEELRAWADERWIRLLRELPFDAATFLGEFERPWERVIDDLGRWCSGFRARPQPERRRLRAVHGRLGLLLLTLVSLRHSYVHRYVRDQATTHEPTHDCAALCVPLLEEPAVREAVAVLYAPGLPVPDVAPGGAADEALARDEWERIDTASLRFHRHGTTSFILTGQPATAAHGHRRPFALKCILYPYLRIPTIVRSTSRYRSRYAVPGSEVRHLAHVWASSTRWILMAFVTGETLSELLRRQPASDAIRLDLLRDLGRELFAAMADLERVQLRHCDLSPSNIIVHHSETGERSFVLVDLGVNYLYSHAVPGAEGPDATYVAPEVRGSDAEARAADVYSVGRLLVAIAGGPADSVHSAPVPDAFYAETPLLARFVEDLTDRDPKRRLLIFRPDRTRPLYPQLLTFFDEELAAVTASRDQRSGGLLRLYTPLAGAPGRQRELWRMRREQSLYADPRRGMHVRWLLAWSWVSATAWYVAATVVITWWLRDLDWNWGNHWVTLLQRTNGAGEEEIPFIDPLRADDYPIPDLRESLPVRMVGLSFLLVGARYYQNLFAGLTPLVTGTGQGRLTFWAFLAEAHMRLAALLAFLLVMPPTLFQRSWWPVFTGIGITCVALCNAACLLFARAAVARARAEGLTTVPTGRIAGLEMFATWTPTAAFYSLAVWTIALAISFDAVHDVGVYAAMVTAINIGLFYIVKCSGSSAAAVRTGLGRACLAAERLRCLREAP